jgi:hypothetical protein
MSESKELAALETLLDGIDAAVASARHVLGKRARARARLLISKFGINSESLILDG